MSDTEEPQSDSFVPMIKEETVKGDGRTLIYYTFPEAHETLPPASPAPEAAHV